MVKKEEERHRLKVRRGDGEEGRQFKGKKYLEGGETGKRKEEIGKRREGEAGRKVKKI